MRGPHCPWAAAAQCPSGSAPCLPQKQPLGCRHTTLGSLASSVLGVASVHTVFLSLGVPVRLDQAASHPSVTSSLPIPSAVTLSPHKALFRGLWG